MPAERPAKHHFKCDQFISQVENEPSKRSAAVFRRFFSLSTGSKTMTTEKNLIKAKVSLWMSMKSQCLLCKARRWKNKKSAKKKLEPNRILCVFRIVKKEIESAVNKRPRLKLSTRIRLRKSLKIIFPHSSIIKLRKKTFAR